MVITFADLSHKCQNVVTTNVLIKELSISVFIPSSFNDAQRVYFQGISSNDFFSVNTLKHEKGKCLSFLILYAQIWFNIQVKYQRMWYIILNNFCLRFVYFWLFFTVLIFYIIWKENEVLFDLYALLIALCNGDNLQM